MPWVKTSDTSSSWGPNNTIETNTNPNVLPLGQKPEGDEFDAALLKLENTFNTLINRLNALEGSLKVLQETNKKLESTIALIDPFNEFKEKPLVLTPDMEVKDGHK